MISENRIAGYRTYTCDGHCGASAKFRSYDEARHSGGWSVSYWRDKCYCPNCAPNYANVGCKGKKPSLHVQDPNAATPQQLTGNN